MEKKISQLTPEQEKKIKEYSEKWMQIGLRTDPTDKEKCEYSLNLCYSVAGLKCPEKIYYVDSIMAANILLNILEVDNQFSLEENYNLGKLVSKASSIRPIIKNFIGEACYGQWDSYWLSYYDFFWRELGIKECEKLSGLFGMAESCGWFWPYEEFVVVSGSPKVIKFDNKNRLHCEDGPAVEFRDGWGIFQWHGVSVPDRAITRKNELTIRTINSEEDNRVHKALIEIYGPRKYIEKMKASVLHHDQYGKMYGNFSESHQDRVIIIKASRKKYNSNLQDEYFVLDCDCCPVFDSVLRYVSWFYDKTEKEYIEELTK